MRSILRNDKSNSRPILYNVLPSEPIGDVFNTEEEGDVDDDTELGDAEIEYEDGDVEEGSPKTKSLSAKDLAKKIANGTATAAEKKAFNALKKANPSVAKYVSSAAKVRKLSQNDSLLYEHLKGAKMLTSSLGAGARLRPTEVTALKSAIHLSTPFEPTNIAMPLDTIDLEDKLFGLIGASPFYFAGIIIILSAATLNINQGAVISVTREFGQVGGATNKIVNNIELASGVGSVEMLLLNGVLVAGQPRFWAPLIAATAFVAQPVRPFKLTFGGLPANYAKSFRFLQPGDQQVDTFLRHV